MMKLIVLVAVLACISASVVPKPPGTHSGVKHDVPSVKSTPLHPEQRSSTETVKPAEVKVDNKKEENKKEENKAKSDSHQEQKTDKKADLKSEIKGIAHHEAHNSAVKHHDVPVSVTHAGKAVGVPHDVPHKSDKVENAKDKPSEVKH